MAKGKRKQKSNYTGVNKVQRKATRIAKQLKKFPNYKAFNLGSDIIAAIKAMGVDVRYSSEGKTGSAANIER